MKGQIVGLVIIVVLVFLFLSGLWGNIIAHSSYSTSVSAKEVSILRKLDQIEAVKIGMDYLANYSILQAFYDVGKFGGWNKTDYEQLTGKNLIEEEYPLWRNYSQILFSYEKLNELIKSYAKENIEKYIPQLNSKFEINFILENVKIDKNFFSVLSNLSYSSEFYKIEDKAYSNISLNPMFFEMYDTGKELFLDVDSAREAINQAEGSLPKDCKDIVITVTNIPNPETVLNEHCPNADERFRNLMIENLEKMSKSFGDFDMNVKVVENQTKHISDYYIRKTFTEKVDDTTITYYEVEYLYNYFGAAKVFVNITTKESFPLYEEKERKVDLRKIILRFSVVSSNDYSWRPI